MDYTEYTKFFIAILAIVDPLAALPVYFAMTQDMAENHRRKLPALLGITITITLLVALFFGQAILHFFGISTGSFRIASGLLLLITAYQMFQQTDLGSVVKQASHSDAVVPLAIPLLAGPGAISTVIVYSTHSSLPLHFLWMGLCIVVLGFVTWLFFSMTTWWIRKVHPLTLAISSKIMGLIIGAIAVEFIANGIKMLVAT